MTKNGEKIWIKLSFFQLKQLEFVFNSLFSDKNSQFNKSFVIR